MAIDLKNLKKVESFDYDEYDGKKSRIANVEELDVETKDFGDGAKEIKQLLITTENLSTDEDNPVIAREYVALKKDYKTGEWGIPSAQDSKAMKILNYFKVSNFSDLIGKECMAVKRVKGDRTFLAIYGG